MPEPPTKVAAPPSLRVSVGVPPVVLTVTAALKLTVSVTAWPAFRSPLPPVIPVPELAIEEIAGEVAAGPWIVTLATDVCHQLLATYSFESQNELRLLGSTVAEE